MNRITILRTRTLLTLAVGIIALLGGFVLAQAPGARAAMNSLALFAVPNIPATFNYQGFLRETDGSLMKGPHTITAKIYDTPTGGTELYSETLQNVNVRDGLFNIVLGDINPLGTTFEASPRYIGITLDNGVEFIPRERVHGVPWAIHASHAADANNATNADFATNAGFANQAGFATSAGSTNTATNATNADNLRGMEFEVYSSGSMDGVSRSTSLEKWKNNVAGTACFLTTTQTLPNEVAYCAITSTNAEGPILTSGEWNFCQAICITWAR